MSEEWKDVQIFQQDLTDKSKLLILIGGLNNPNPGEYLDRCVQNLVNNQLYGEFVDKHMDNPYIRIIIINMNELQFDPYDSSRV